MSSSKPLHYLLVLLVSAVLTASLIFYFYPIRNVSLPAFILSFVGVTAVTFLYFKWKPFLTKDGKNLWVTAGSILLSIYFLFSIRGEQVHLEDNNLITVLITYLLTLIFIYLLVSALIYFLLKVSFITHEHRNLPFSRFLAYFIPIVAVLLTYWVAFYPAAMTPDSLAQWDQAHTGDFNDWHPVIFTWIIMFLTWLWDSPGIISLLQIFMISTVVAYSLFQFEKIGVPKKFLYGVTAFFVILPVSGIFPIIIWKDVLYSAFMLLFSTHVFNIVYSKGLWIRNKWSIAGLLFSSIGLVFFRHNGFPVFIIVLLALLITYRARWKQLATVFIVMIGLHFIMSGPVFKALDVTPSDPNEALSIPTQQLALIVIKDGEMSESEKQYVNDIFPLELWEERYKPYNTNPIKFSWEEYDRDVIFEDFGKYVKTWFSLWWKNPGIAFEAFFTHTSLVWQMNQPENGYTDTYVTNIYYGNEQGLVDKILVPSITNGVSQYLENTKEWFGFIIWRPAVYFSLMLVFSVVAIARNGWKYGLVFLPILLNILSVMAALPAQDFRYLYSNTLVVFLLFMMMFVKQRVDKGGISDE
jgi:Family of unknown function (DUF6020)